MITITTPSITTTPSLAMNDPPSIAYYPPQGDIIFMVDNSLVTEEELNVKKIFENNPNLCLGSTTSDNNSDSKLDAF